MTDDTRRTAAERRREMGGYFLPQRAAAAALACSERSFGVWFLSRARVALAAFFRAAATLAGVLARPIAAAAFWRAVGITLGSIAQTSGLDKRANVG